MFADGIYALNIIEDFLISYLNSEKIKNLNPILKFSKNYLKFSYKNYFSNQCIDHCLFFALCGDVENPCVHNH